MTNDAGVFVKRQDEHASTWEAAGLEWLGEATAHGGVRVVRVREILRHALVLDKLHECEPTPRSAYELGAALARTHGMGVGHGGFGVGPPAWHRHHDAHDRHGLQGPHGQQIPLLLANPLAEPAEFSSWGSMYAQLRVAPLSEKITGFDASERRIWQHLCSRLDDGVFDDAEPPARIHGDLWSGNLVYTHEGGVLIDPAAYAGHRESDLAALALFGTPYLEQVYRGYRSEYPLGEGWERRVGLHQLHLVLLHAVLFGGGYARRALEIAREYV